jgi:hypothetical protein
MNIIYDVSENEQLNNLDFCNNSTLIYISPFSISLSILPNVPTNLKSEQDIVEYINNALSPLCENTTDVFSKIMVFVGQSNKNQCDPKAEKTSSSKLSIESGLGSEMQCGKGDLRGGCSTISTTSGFDITVVIDQISPSRVLFQNQKDVGGYFEKVFFELVKQDWDITVRVGMMCEE